MSAIYAAVPPQLSQPWDAGGAYRFDRGLLLSLIEVQLAGGSALVAASGGLALAVDVWIATKLRRAGIDPDAVCAASYPAAHQTFVGDEGRVRPNSFVGTLRWRPDRQASAPGHARCLTRPENEPFADTQLEVWLAANGPFAQIEREVIREPGVAGQASGVSGPRSFEPRRVEPPDDAAA
jgi:hypothetical protein